MAVEVCLQFVTVHASNLLFLIAYSNFYRVIAGGGWVKSLIKQFNAADLGRRPWCCGSCDIRLICFLFSD